VEEQKFPSGWIVVDHIIPGVTTEMLDWWWVNMEKGYELWCPDEHKGFRWQVKPPLGGHIGAVQIATESIDYGPVRDLRIDWVDPNLGTPDHKKFWTYEHLLAAGSAAAKPGDPPWVMLSHQYEAIPGGCKMRSCMHVPPGMPPGVDPTISAPGPLPPHPSGKKPSGGGWRVHNIAEVSTFKAFLPALWGIWQSVPDPAINRRCSLKIKKEGPRIIYIQ
jgi:DAPG hydrolase PhiG domain